MLDQAKSHLPFGHNVATAWHWVVNKDKTTHKADFAFFPLLEMRPPPSSHRTKREMSEGIGLRTRNSTKIEQVTAGVIQAQINSVFVDSSASLVLCRRINLTCYHEKRVWNSFVVVQSSDERVLNSKLSRPMRHVTFGIPIGRTEPQKKELFLEKVVSCELSRLLFQFQCLSCHLKNVLFNYRTRILSTTSLNLVVHLRFTCM